MPNFGFLPVVAGDGWEMERDEVGFGGVGLGEEGLEGLEGSNLAVRIRYLRFFNFVGRFEKAWDIFKYDSGLRMLIGVGKSGFMGAYLLLESLTILDMMGVYTSPWAEFLLVEGNKFWFYALVVSIFGEFYELWYICFSSSQPAATSKSRTSEKSSTASSKEKSKRQWEKRSKIKHSVLRIVADAADLFVPGAVTGWIPTDPGVVGIATMISTVLSSRDLWERAGRR
ncbi:Peroxisomal biogenesis factor 11 protein [Rutstroemia sp. NJR-2017a BBW]|nr:Peroxisomal biogenesis factor 11 protein [Rutstroemia sp. NJR-2017a BBW]